MLHQIDFKISGLIQLKRRYILTIDSRAANSGEMTWGDSSFWWQIGNEETFKVYSTDYNNHISTLTYE